MSRAIGFYGKFSPLSLCRPKDERSAIEQYRGEIMKGGQKEKKKGKAINLTHYIKLKMLQEQTEQKSVL